MTSVVSAGPHDEKQANDTAVAELYDTKNGGLFGRRCGCIARPDAFVEWNRGLTSRCLSGAALARHD
ncbi:MAG TPA: hypothetical protein VNA16_04460 [Abditibacteriaceae bacterium]|nr:hypothetical protein [Abditibacteriaceae bacterium]